jgi:hypothetical protein
MIQHVLRLLGLVLAAWSLSTNFVLASVDFDSGESYSRQTSGPDYTVHTGMCWVYKDSISAEGSIISRGDSTTIRMAISAAGKLVLNSGGTHVITGTTTLSATTWYHVAVTQDTSNNWELFLNGVSEGTASHATDPSGTAMIRFAYDDGAGNSLIGQLAACRIYNAELSGAEITTEMNSWTAVRTSNLWGAWRWETSPSVTDESGNGNDLTATGTLTTGSSNPSIGGGGPDLTPFFRRRVQ